MPSSLLAADVVDALLKQLVAAGTVVRFYRQTFWMYRDGHYQQKSEHAIKARVYTFLEQNQETPTQRLIDETHDLLQSKTFVDDEVEMPVLIGDGFGPDYSYIAVANGLLDLDSLFNGDPLTQCLRSHTSDWFSANVMEYDFDPAADCPLWLSTLDRIFAGDRWRIRQIQEWFGYCLVPGNEYRKLLMLVGEPSTGKSTILNVLNAVLGKANVSAVQFEQLGGRFQLSGIYGKLCNIGSEIGEMSKASEGILKAITGNDDAIGFERKHKDPFSAKPQCKLAFATNNLPRYADRTTATVDRHLLVPCTQRLSEQEKDPHWGERLKAELPGIFNWALVGRHRLLRQGRFSTSVATELALVSYRQDNLPVDVFLKDFVVADAKGAVPVEDLYAIYKDLATRHGQRVLAISSFGRAVKQAFPRSERARMGSPRSGTRSFSQRTLEQERLARPGDLRQRSLTARSYVYRGIRLLADNEVPEELGLAMNLAVPVVMPPVGLLGSIWKRLTPASQLALPFLPLAGEDQHLLEFYRERCERLRLQCASPEAAVNELQRSRDSNAAIAATSSASKYNQTDEGKLTKAKRRRDRLEKKLATDRAAGVSTGPTERKLSAVRKTIERLEGPTVDELIDLLASDQAPPPRQAG